MRVLLAFDKFKDALPAREACEIVARVLHGKHPNWECDLCPLTDGGEGFCETLTRAAKGRLEEASVSGPRGDPTHAPSGWIAAENLPARVRQQLGLRSGETLAVIEMASASGLALIPPAARDLWFTSTRGTGEQIRLAAQRGAAAILLGVGGSATNDLGLGALAALGFKFLDAHDVAINLPVPAEWARIRRIDRPEALTLPPIFIACDVTNPLLGPNGATATFGPQKGLRAADFARLEAEMSRLAALLCTVCERPGSLREMPGAGAAGGIGFGLMAAADARLVAGFDLVCDWLNLHSRLAQADLVITGEGRFDSTSLEGKGPGSLLAEARRSGKTTHVFAGRIDLPQHAQSELAGFHSITPEGMSLAEALPRTGEFLEAAVRSAL